MPTNSFQANQGTQSNLLTDNTGGTTSAGTLIPVMKISTDAQGTFGTLWNGNVGINSGTVSVSNGTVNSGTVNTGTINTGTINTGTINLGTVVGKDANAAAQTGNPMGIGGTDSGGTIRTAKIDATGLQHTLQEIGTVNTGTINTGTINTGTINIATVTAGTVNTGTVNTGTINVATVTAGTINTGTFRLDARTTQNILTFGTQIANSGAAAATIVGSASVGAGTSLWLQDVSITNSLSALATVILGFGTTQQGTNVLLRATLGTSGAVGIEKSLGKAVNAGMTNQDLVFSTTGSGTVDLTISYFISA